MGDAVYAGYVDADESDTAIESDAANESDSAFRPHATIKSYAAVGSHPADDTGDDFAAHYDHDANAAGPSYQS